MNINMMSDAVSMPIGIDTVGYPVSGTSDVVEPVPVMPGQTGIGTGQDNDRGSGEEITETEADRRMKSVVDQANEKVKQQNGYRRLAFSYNESTKRISIKVYDELTKEIIREIPPEKTIEMLQRVYDLAGIMVDEKR